MSDLGMNSGISITTKSYIPTITLVGGSGNVVPDFTTVEGLYTRYGNLVLLEINITNTSGGTAGAGTGLVNISVPFTASSNQIVNQAPCGRYINGSVSNELFASIPASTATLTMGRNSSASSFVFVIGSDLNNGSRSLRIHFFYYAV